MSDALAEAVARVWPDGRSTWEVLGGGITNHNVKVSRPDGVVVLRVAGKDTDLLGIDRTVELAATRAAAEPDRRLRCLTLADPRAVALGSEPVRVGDDPVGRVTSGGYGYTVGASIAYAYLPAEHDVGTEVAVEIFGEWVAGVVAVEPLYDLAGEKIRA